MQAPKSPFKSDKSKWFFFHQLIHFFLRKKIVGKLFLEKKYFEINNLQKPHLLSTKTKNQRLNNGGNLQTAQHIRTKDWANPLITNQKSHALLLYIWIASSMRPTFTSNHSLMHFHLFLTVLAFSNWSKEFSVVHVYS